MTDEARDKLFEKIRGLLRKAENTKFEEEADAFIRKAQELMLRYSVDEEELWAKDPERRSKIEEIVINIPDKSPGAEYKRIILSRIANLSNCKMWYITNGNKSKVAGFPVDLVWVDMLFTSVMTQANFKLAFAQAISDENARTFRTNFWAGFCSRITVRLNEAYAKAREQVDEDTGSSTDLVLVDRRTKVAQYVQQNLNLTSSRYRDNSRYSHGARSAGVHAADTTDISGGKRTINKPRGALNG